MPIVAVVMEAVGGPDRSGERSTHVSRRTALVSTVGGHGGAAVRRRRAGTALWPSGGTGPRRAYARESVDGSRPRRPPGLSCRVGFAGSPNDDSAHSEEKGFPELVATFRVGSPPGQPAVPAVDWVHPGPRRFRLDGR